MIVDIDLTFSMTVDVVHIRYRGDMVEVRGYDSRGDLVALMSAPAEFWMAADSRCSSVEDRAPIPHLIA